MLQSAFHGSDPVVGGFDVELIDEVVHGRLRLGVLAALAEEGGASFPALKARLKAATAISPATCAPCRAPAMSGSRNASRPTGR